MAYQMHVSIPYFSAIPDDVCTNVWSFNYVTLNPSNADWTALQTRLKTFYNAVYAGTASSLTMANYAVPSLTTWKGYDLTDAIPRAPRFSSTSALTPGTPAATFLPPETALCLSFQGTQVSGLPQSQRRGRIFLGVLATIFDSSSGSAFPTVNATRRAGICSAAANFATGAAIDGWTWGVWSRTTNTLVPVNNGWVDNAGDTQRRRGQAANSRSTFTA